MAYNLLNHTSWLVVDLEPGQLGSNPGFRMSLVVGDELLRTQPISACCIAIPPTARLGVSAQALGCESPGEGTRESVSGEQRSSKHRTVLVVQNCGRSALTQVWPGGQRITVQWSLMSERPVNINSDTAKEVETSHFNRSHPQHLRKQKWAHDLLESGMRSGGLRNCTRQSELTAHNSPSWQAVEFLGRSTTVVESI